MSLSGLSFNTSKPLEGNQKKGEIHTENMAITSRIKVEQLLGHSKIADLRKLALRHIANNTRQQNTIHTIPLPKINRIPHKINIDPRTRNMASHPQFVMQQRNDTGLVTSMQHRRDGRRRVEMHAAGVVGELGDDGLDVDFDDSRAGDCVAPDLGAELRRQFSEGVEGC